MNAIPTDIRSFMVSERAFLMNAAKYEQNPNLCLGTSGMFFKTKTTNEHTCFHAAFMNVSDEALAMAGLDLKKAYELYGLILNEATEASRGPYKVSKYIDMFRQVAQIAVVLKHNAIDTESRQLVIQFEKLHCFQSIQLLLRGNSIIVETHMRSCNFDKNFLMDLFLSYSCALRLSKLLKGIFTFTQIHVIMNIGSLHSFLEEN